MGLSICPLHGKGGSAKSREAIKAELAARDEKVWVLISAGRKGVAICKELGITKSMLRESMRRLRERGETN